MEPKVARLAIIAQYTGSVWVTIELLNTLGAYNSVGSAGQDILINVGENVYKEDKTMVQCTTYKNLAVTYCNAIVLTTEQIGINLSASPNAGTRVFINIEVFNLD